MSPSIHGSAATGAASLSLPLWAGAAPRWLTWLATWWPLLITTVLVGAAMVAGAVVLLRRWRHRRLCTGARLVTIAPPPQADPAGGAALWSTLLGLLRPAWARLLLGQPHLGFEYRFASTGITIHLWVPGPVPPGLVERAIVAAWPGARTHTTPAPHPGAHHTPTQTRPAHARPATVHLKPGDPAMVESERVVAGGRLRLARGDALPIDDHDRRGIDPVRGVLAAPGPLPPGDEVWIQILARPITSRRLTHTGQAGGPGHLVGLAVDLLVGVLRELLDLATPGPVTQRPRPDGARSGATHGGAGRANGTLSDAAARARLTHTAQNRAAVDKARGGAYATSIRYLAHTTVPTLPAGNRAGDPAGAAAARARARKQGRALVRGRCHAVGAAFARYTDLNHYRRHRLLRPATTLPGRRFGRGDVLSVSELAALAHLPVDEHVPGLTRAGANAVAPPPQVPTSGAGVKTLGDSDHTRHRPVGVSVPDARHHLHVLGATGAGKSTLLARMILDDAHAGRGVVVIDPKGDLVTDIAARLPAGMWRDGRVVLLDPDHPGPPPCLNPLAPHPTHDPGAAGRGGWAGDIAAEHVVSVFRRIFAATWGPRTDDLLRAACLTLRAGPEVPSLAAIPPLLTDPHARARATRHIHTNHGNRDDVLGGFWTWFDTLSDPARAQITAPLLNKLRAVLLRPFARAALCAGPSTVNLQQVLDRGGILLARLPKGALGEETTRLVGSMLLAQTWQATTARAHQPPAARRDASLVIDECHNFLNLPYPIEDMLAEARGFAVSLTLAHQNLAQLPRDLRDGIATNARNKIFFAVSPDDATHLARHTTPELGAHDLANLDAFHAAARLVVHGAHTPAFTLTTRPLPPPRADTGTPSHPGPPQPPARRPHPPGPHPPGPIAGSAPRRRTPHPPPRHPSSRRPPPHPRGHLPAGPARPRPPAPPDRHRPRP